MQRSKVELRIKAKDKIMHKDMFVAYVVAWQPTPMQLWVRIPRQYWLFVFFKILIFFDNYYLVNKSVLDKKNYIFGISARYRIEWYIISKIENFFKIVMVGDDDRDGDFYIFRFFSFLTSLELARGRYPKTFSKHLNLYGIWFGIKSNIKKCGLCYTEVKGFRTTGV